MLVGLAAGDAELLGDVAGLVEGLLVVLLISFDEAARDGDSRPEDDDRREDETSQHAAEELFFAKGTRFM